jgi:hypothetical protein
MVSPSITCMLWLPRCFVLRQRPFLGVMPLLRILLLQLLVLQFRLLVYDRLGHLLLYVKLFVGVLHKKDSAIDAARVKESGASEV